MRDLVVPSTVLEVGGERVGVIGYLTPDTAEIADIGRMDITDEVEAVGREAQRLHEAGVQFIVALGHSGFEKDREVAALVPHVDIVVGGHSDTFLYSGDDVGESRRKPENGHHHKGGGEAGGQWQDRAGGTGLRQHEVPRPPDGQV